MVQARLGRLRVSGVDSFSTELRRADDSQGCIDPSLPGFAVEKTRHGGGSGSRSLPLILSVNARGSGGGCQVA
jgi:hypothetical protein